MKKIRFFNERFSKGDITNIFAEGSIYMSCSYVFEDWQGMQTEYLVIAKNSRRSEKVIVYDFGRFDIDNQEIIAKSKRYCNILNNLFASTN